MADADHETNAEPITRLADVRAPHNVVGAFDGLRSARTVIHELEEAGIEPSHISLLGAQMAETSEEIAEEAHDPPPTETGRGTAFGAAAGLTVGGVAGLTVGIPGVGPLIAAGLWAALGGAIGSTLGGVRSTGLSRAWNQTFEAVREGNVAVGVHSDDPDEVDSAALIMSERGGMSVNRFDD